MAEPIVFKIFLSSPGDVAQERDDAQTVIQEINDSHEFDNHFILKLYRWDDKSVVLPMAVHDIPQKSVDLYMIRPSGCDLVVVLFWSRMGSPLVMDSREYLSGTHYEYSEALQGYEQYGRPPVWLYRCAEEPSIKLSDPNVDDKLQQYRRVDQFFKQFQDSEGRYTGGINAYDAHADFKPLFKAQLITYLRHLRDKPHGTEPIAAAKKPAFTGVPYRGLNALNPEDAPIFFGREEETLEVLSRINAKRLVFVLGASGSGKSSLVAAGVLPRLPKHEWRIVRFVPGTDPFLSLARALVTQLPELGVKPIDYLSESQKLAGILGQSPANLVDQLTLMLSQTYVLLFVDQFEEVFTLATKNAMLAADSVQIFMQALRHSHPAATVKTLITMRADFYGAALPYFDELKQQAYGLTRPSPFALFEMITRPAELAGLRLDDGLAEEIVTGLSGESGALALMSYVLESLYLRAQARDDERLSRHDYDDELHGVQGAINTLAERAYAELPFDEDARQKAMQHVFRELVAVTEEDGQIIPTRRRASLANFITGSNEAALIEAFVRARLLVTENETVEVAHESVFRSWERLAAWIAEAQEDLILLRQMGTAADQWAHSGRDKSFLWPHERLLPVYAMRERLNPGLNEVQRDFIKLELERLIDELSHSTTHHIRRAQIGDRLAEIGDTRPGVGLRPDGIPDIAWCNVPAGKVSLEKLGSFQVESFAMAKYPVTYVQYKAFLEAPDGYHDNRWWQDLDHEPDPGTQNRPTDNHPAENVSWFDAMAFCRWLTVCQIKAGLIPDTAEIRLPTEWEWQHAATSGNADHEYPWGTEDDTARANTSESGLSRTTAVGMYPQGGVIKLKILDMSGNVWEWCLNEYTSGKVNNVSSSESRGLRGGSWYNYSLYARASNRSYDNPYYHKEASGFRVILVLNVSLF